MVPASFLLNSLAPGLLHSTGGSCRWRPEVEQEAGGRREGGGPHSRDRPGEYREIPCWVRGPSPTLPLLWCQHMVANWAHWSHGDDKVVGGLICIDRNFDSWSTDSLYGSEDASVGFQSGLVINLSSVLP